SWRWAFRPTWRQLLPALPERVLVRNVLGGLAPDTDTPMPDEMRRKVRGIWQTIQATVPGTAFNFDFWTRCTPCRSTYPACRAVIAAERRGPEFEEAMILGIQEAYYLRAMNPSDASVLMSLAAKIGIDRTQFAEELNSPNTRDELAAQIEFARRIGAHSFPSLVARRAGRFQLLPFHYTDPGLLLAQLV
ncbi:MAG: DsbA family protein, partial [Pseudomonadota bacterium]